ncbi:MAG: class I SAM-dependent methyltransferase [Kiritimatiellae bacterium]|nr:class I SAM-dependent methyltransferase [Kiritimatiellia bacterium]
MDYTTTQSNRKLSITQRIRRTVNGLGHTHTCCICGKSFFRFAKFRGGWANFSQYLKDVKWTGSDFDHFWCPFCKSHDRERHLMLYMDRLGLWPSITGADVLHFAPEKWVIRKIESLHPKTYRKGDLFPSREGVEKIDVTAIPFPDQSFDWVICNHVLEHVPDDRKAMRELLRILKPGGHAILQTPFAAKLETTRENEPDILASDDKKIEFYGQEDHTRIYGTDFFERLKQTGFNLSLKRHSEILPDIDAVKFGVNPDEPLIMATRE